MEFFLKKFRAAVCVQQVFRRVAPRGHLQAHRSALKRRVHLHHPLTVRMVQSFGNPQNGRKPPGNPLVVVVQRGIRRMMTRRLRFSVVISRQGRNDGPVPAFQTRYISIHHQVFAMLVMPMMTDHVPDVVQQRTRLQQNSSLRRQMVHRLKLVEKQNAQLADVLGVRLVLL